MYAGNDCEMPGGNEQSILDALEAGDTVMRLGDLQRSAMKMLNSIKDTKVFDELLVKVEDAQKLELSITKQPESTSAALGKKVVVSVEATGEGLTYEWYWFFKNTGNDIFFFSDSIFVSEDGTTYGIPMNSWRDGQQVYCVIRDVNNATLQTNSVVLRMKK